MRGAMVVAALAMSVGVGGCLGTELQQSQQQVQQNQVQIEALQKEIEGLKSQGSGGSSTPPPGVCDPDVKHTALSKGDDKIASGDFKTALGYYQDALTSCPKDPEAEMALGRAYEGLGQNDLAIAQYRIVAASDSTADATIRQQAEQSLARLGASK